MPFGALLLRVRDGEREGAGALEACDADAEAALAADRRRDSAVVGGGDGAHGDRPAGRRGHAEAKPQARRGADVEAERAVERGCDADRPALRAAAERAANGC